MGSQITGLDAEVDLASIDKVDVRNELCQFTLFGGLEADFQKLGPYCNRRLPHYLKTSKSMIGPADPVCPYQMSRPGGCVPVGGVTV